MRSAEAQPTVALLGEMLGKLGELLLEERELGGGVNADDGNADDGKSVPIR